MQQGFSVHKIKVKKGDEVVMLSGKDKGKKGVVKTVFSKKPLVVVDGVSVFKRSAKVTGTNNHDNFVFKERPVFISKVRVIKKSVKSSSAKK